MLIKVTYAKVSGSLSVENDLKDVTVEVADNATVDTSGSLYFEIAVDTSTYESVNSIDEDLIIE